jgi:hypothetical protein
VPGRADAGEEHLIAGAQAGGRGRDRLTLAARDEPERARLSVDRVVEERSSFESLVSAAPSAKINVRIDAFRRGVLISIVVFFRTLSF